MKILLLPFQKKDRCLSVAFTILRSAFTLHLRFFFVFLLFFNFYFLRNACCIIQLVLWRHFKIKTAKGENFLKRPLLCAFSPVKYFFWCEFLVSGEKEHIEVFLQYRVFRNVSHVFEMIFELKCVGTSHAPDF